MPLVFNNQAKQTASFNQWYNFFEKTLFWPFFVSTVQNAHSEKNKQELSKKSFSQYNTNYE